jgi:hypothetical protein
LDDGTEKAKDNSLKFIDLMRFFALLRMTKNTFERLSDKLCLANLIALLVWVLTDATKDMCVLIPNFARFVPDSW